MQKSWNIKQPDPQQSDALSQELKIHPIIARLLINRNITDIDEAKIFLSADLNLLHDPFQLKGMTEAVARIRLACERKEKILVFGDYDVDGVTSSALLYSELSRMGLNVINHIPHRMHDGYGLNHEIADTAVNEGVSLLITVDCGITAVEEVKTLTSKGLDVIIIDHHEPGEAGAPEALAIINPKQKECPYPFKELASVGLTAKVLQALRGQVPVDCLDLVAIGTIADIVPLRGENRIFVKAGLPLVNKTDNKGLQALLEVSKIKGKKISPFHVGFILGPRINATGRMDSAHTSLELLLAEDSQKAYQLAFMLEQHNVDRQKMQKQITDEAMALVEQEINFKTEKVIVVSKEGWHKGVLGIVASKMADKYYRPSIVISLENGVGTASARSINGFHLHEALQDCSQCLETFGGHEAAAGLTIRQENIDLFKDLINKTAVNILERKKLSPVITIDCEINLSDISLDLANIIDTLEPFGEGNPLPLFCTYGVIAKSYGQALGRETLKFWVTDGNAAVSVVGFGMAKFKPLIKPGTRLDLVFQIAIDDWNKAPVPQLLLKDIRVSEDAE